MIVSRTQKPIVTGVYAPETWERGLDPWHAGAFPDGFKHAGTTGQRREGWLGLDWVGNPIVFVADGTEIDSGDQIVGEIKVVEAK